MFKKGFWIVLLCVVALSLGVIYKYMHKALPFVHVKIAMSDAQARSKALDIAHKNNWDIAGYQSVAYFYQDSTLQAFVELEGGGRQAFVEMMERGYFAPYLWIVRLYKPNTIQEFKVRFLPDGSLYEFEIKMPHDQPGAALDRQEAEKIVQKGIESFNVDMSSYQSIEYHKKVQTSGRVDHGFVYERQDIKLGKAVYQIAFMVCGDQLTSIDHRVKIPDEFNRRYGQMYSTNFLLAKAARNVALLLYLFIIALFALLYFYKDLAYLKIRQHATLILLFGAIVAQAIVNQWPLIWSEYETHSSPFIFILHYLGSNCISLFCFTSFVGFICIIADACDRFSFPRHIQFLKTWAQGVGGSYEVLSLTMLGYLLAIVKIAVFVGYYILVQSWGWWIPMSTLIDPNLLSTYMPWLEPISGAFGAGFWEEFALRALPLAGIVVLTRNVKYKSWWFWGMMIMQALIFGALHANYPQLPAYNRIVELFLPSISYGLLYYFFGLYPCIIMHFFYDAILMSIPIWISDLWIQKILCVVGMSVPLLVVFWRWLQQGRQLVSVPARAYNHDVRYQEPLQEQDSLRRVQGDFVSQKVIFLFAAIMLLGAACWYNVSTIQYVDPAVTVSAQQAIAQATKVVQQYGLSEDVAWTCATELQYKDLEGCNFIWQTCGSQMYQKLMGTYIHPVYWNISWKMFEGSVEQRAQQYNIIVSPVQDGSVLGMRHIFPEQLAGADMSEAQALEKAYASVYQWYNLDEHQLSVALVESKKHEHRRDWMIEFQHQDPSISSIGLGQLRILVKLAGDQLSEIQRFVHTPQQWQRQDQSRTQKESMIKYSLFAFMVLWIVFAVLLGIRRYGLHMNIISPILFIAFWFVVIRCINLCNSWPILLQVLNTVEPRMHQLTSIISSQVMYYVALCSAQAAVLVLCVLLGKKAADKTSWWMLMLCMISGVAVAYCGLFFDCHQIYMSSYQPMYDYVNFSIPALAMLVLYFLTEWIKLCMAMASLSIVASYARKKYSLWVVYLLFICAGIALSNTMAVQGIAWWLLSGVTLGTLWYGLYVWVIQENIDAVFLITYGMMVGSVIPSVLYQAYPTIRLDFVICLVCTLPCMVWLYRKI